MADLKRRSLRILTTLLLLLVVVGLVGHFGVDISGREPLTACDFHTGLILLPLIAVCGVLTLVTTLLDNNPIGRWRLLPPHVQPPISLP
jgi:heme A synthase